MGKNLFTTQKEVTKNILIITTNQFGYLTDTTKYCEYLKKTYNITYVCWDYGLPKIQHDQLKVSYISRNGNKIIRYFKFLKTLNNEIRESEYDLVFIKYFLGISFIKIFNSKVNYNIDIRTNAIKESRFSRYFYDSLLKYECSFFKKITVVSASLAKSLRLKNWHELPLGGDRFTIDNKSFKDIHLLYVGTLHMRNILECVKGFHKYLIERKSNEDVNLCFTIIGDAAGNELQEIRDYIFENQLGEVIETLGYVYYDDLNKYFGRANIGVSFIPMTKYFDNQPPTKTYEYLVSGLPVIATKTNENVKILNDLSGVLIDDNKDSFAMGLQAIISKREVFNSEIIRKMYKNNLWENIVTDNLKKYIDTLVK